MFTTIDGEGNLIIPDEIWESLGWQIGDRIQMGIAMNGLIGDKVLFIQNMDAMERNVLNGE